jgi:hypothetical protein
MTKIGCALLVVLMAMLVVVSDALAQKRVSPGPNEPVPGDVSATPNEPSNLSDQLTSPGKAKAERAKVPASESTITGTSDHPNEPKNPK